MMRAVLVSCGVLSLAVCLLNTFAHRVPLHAAQSAASQSAGSQPQADPTSRAVLSRYCVTCHNQRLKTAGLALDTLDLNNVSQHAETWEKVVKKLRSGAMPPAGSPRPEKAASDAAAVSLERAIDAAAVANPDPGKAPIGRLNRAEYTNAIRDLLALEIDGRSLLPPDETGYGFDNIYDVLSISPALLERYLVAAGTISRLAIGSPSIRPSIQTYGVPVTLRQDDRLSEELPFGSRGGVVFRHYFPLDGEYRLKIVLQRAYQNQIRGLGESTDVELRLDRERLKVFTVGGNGPRNAWAAVSNPSLYEQTADEGLEVRVKVTAGMRLVSATFPKTYSVEEGVLEPRAGVSSHAFTRDRNAPMAVDSIQISGPYDAQTPKDTPSRRQIFVCQPESRREETPCATKILSNLARRAFRRPIDENDVKPFLKLSVEGSEKAGFEAGIEAALRGILIDPEFLFHIERDPASLPPATVYRLGDVELASRLSFFLWSSIPDEELLALAERGALKDAATLRQQIVRMVRDARSDAFISNFFGQWLLLRNLRDWAPDTEAFPDFDENLRAALQRETQLFVESQVREDRSVIDMLLSDYTFLNERLARHYGVANVYGNHFRRVTFPDQTRGGLLGQGSILTVTSYPNRTSPTLRGLWILQNLLGAPPPPPPPDVPSLPDVSAAKGESVSMRARMDMHRTNAVCASCHARMDPLGFALENFDGIGMWRTREGTTTIDASGTLPDGRSFEGAAGLRKVLLDGREQFVQTATEKLLTYALGRGVEFYDAPAVRKITREAAADDYRWSSLIAGIVNSMPFQFRRSRES